MAILRTGGAFWAAASCTAASTAVTTKSPMIFLTMGLLLLPRAVFSSSCARSPGTVLARYPGNGDLICLRRRPVNTLHPAMKAERRVLSHKPPFFLYCLALMAALLWALLPTRVTFLA